MDGEQQKRLDELKAKAEGPGLTSDEANELGKLYAVESGADYANATTGDTGLSQEDADNEMLRKEQAAAVAAKAHDEYRSRMLPGEGSVGA
jgi:hypothetical protein